MRRWIVGLMLLIPLGACRGRTEGGIAAPPARDGRVLWSVDVAAVANPNIGLAVSADGTVYVQGRQAATVRADGRPAIAGIHQQAVLHAIDSTGRVLRSLPGTNIDYLPNFNHWVAIAPWGAAYAVDSEGGLYGMFTDGTQQYRQVKRHINGPPAIAADGRLLVGTGEGALGLYVESEQDGIAIVHDDTSHALAPVLLPDGGMYLSTLRYLYALDALGEIRWSLRTVQSRPAVGPQGAVYYSNKNRLMAADANGSQLWEYHSDDDLGPAAAAPDGGAVAIGMQGLVHSVGPDGRQRWSFAMDTAIWAPPVVAGDGTTYVTDRLGRVVAITPAGKRHWSVKLPMGCTTPALGDAGTAYVACGDGKVYALAPP